MTDIVTEIDALIDQQLAGGEPRRGHDYGDPTYPKCPHCDRHWHGLKITEQIAAMYDRGTFDEGYTAATDDSPVICEGSEFIGPIRAPSEVQQFPRVWGLGTGWHMVGTLRDDGPTMTPRIGVPFAWPEMHPPPTRSATWLDDLIDATMAYTADVLGDVLSFPFTLWLSDDRAENRLLPMPLRYAATHPQSPQAIVEVLSR